MAVLLSAFLTPSLRAHEEDGHSSSDREHLAGHSLHGEVFDEGPRQAAYLMEGTGRVDFRVTTSSPLAQQFFNQGLGQLHGFWYFEAERSFRQAAAIDPDCAMAYWGMAQANASNHKRSNGFIAEATSRSQQVSDREKMYIAAFQKFVDDKKKGAARYHAYADALREIVAAYPHDIEAKALLVLQTWLNHYYKREPLIADFAAVDAILDEVLAVEPLHPCHHYRIHLWDHENEEMALESAELCGPAGPAIAHMWHMPGGHVYYRLKKYRQAVWCMEASARVDHAHLVRDRVLPDQIFNYTHNNEWLVRCLANVGRVHDSIELAKNMIELPRHPKHNMLDGKGSAYYGRARLLHVLTSYEMWDTLIELADTPYLDDTGCTIDQQDMRLYYLAMAHLRVGDVKSASVPMKELEARLREQIAASSRAVKEAEIQVRAIAERNACARAASGEIDETGASCAHDGGDPPANLDGALAKAKSDAAQPYLDRYKKLRSYVFQLRGLLAVVRGNYNTGLKLLTSYGFSDKMFLARLHITVGNKEQAERIARDYASKHENEALPLAHLAEILAYCRKTDEAAEVFEELRNMSAGIDLDVPPFASLAPLAQRLGYASDWRAEPAAGEAALARPSLESLGPFRWTPSPAPRWTLAGADQKPVSLTDFRGKPVVVIFYLGYGCLHCAEQLAAFAPKMGDFAKEGIELIAISSDDRQGLKVSLENYDSGRFPIPLLSNEKLDVFKAYRAFDDFEDMALHGTFLIDKDGLIRWQDISYEPFMDADFLLDEAKRLLDDDVLR